MSQYVKTLAKNVRADAEIVTCGPGERGEDTARRVVDLLTLDKVAWIGFGRRLAGDYDQTSWVVARKEHVKEFAPTGKTDECDHGVHFNAEIASAYEMTFEEIRRHYPRLDGECPKGCGFCGIAYASQAHYVYGDW